MGRTFGIEDSRREWEVLKSLEGLGFWQGVSSVAETLTFHFSGITVRERTDL